jgi:hypothetical protein
LPPPFTLVSCWLIFDPEDGGDMFLRKAGWLSTDYVGLYLRRWYSSKSKLVPPLSLGLSSSLVQYYFDIALTIVHSFRVDGGLVSVLYCCSVFGVGWRVNDNS